MIVGFGIACCSISCSSPTGKLDDEYGRERYSINPELHTDGLKLSQYTVDSIHPLNIPDDAVEMAAEKVSIVNGRVYILDKWISKKLYVFDYMGNIRATIGERGHARGEFIGQPDEFFVDDCNRLHVFDMTGHKINVFDEDGKVEDVVETTDLYPFSFGLTTGGKYMMYFSDGYRDRSKDEETLFSLLMFDKDYKNQETIMPTNEKINCFISSHTFFQDADRLSFIPPFSDSVIIFRDESIEKVVTFDFGGKNFIKEQSKTSIQGYDYSLTKDYKGVLGITRYQETNSLVYLQYNHQHRDVIWLYNKRNGKIVHGSSIFEGIAPYTYYNIDGNQIIAYVNEKIVEFYKQKYSDEKIQNKLKKSPAYIKDMLEGRIKVPALVYITLK